MIGQTAGGGTLEISERRCEVVDRRCRESEGKAKMEGYMSLSDGEAHHRFSGSVETE